MIGFIDDHRAEYGVEPICRVLPIAPSTFYDYVAITRDPARASDRAKRDEVLRREVQRIWDQNFKVYGVRKVWHQMRREGFDVARCTVERVMRQLGIQGVVRGKPQKTTRQDKALPCPRDKVNRQFRAPAPNVLRVSDFTYVSAWQGFVYVAARPLFSNQLRTRSRSSTPSPTGSLAGGRHGPRRRSSCSMHWNKRSMSDGRRVILSITATGAVKADPTGRRNTFDHILYEQPVESFGWCLPSQCFPGARV